jgi:hypothetical protein
MKLRVALATAALSAAALLGLSACGLPFAAAADSATTMTPEASALSSLGFSQADVTTVDDPSPSPGASTAPGSSATPRAGTAKRPRPRALTVSRALRKNVEHGEVVVKTKDGDKTIDVQRGTVTAINSTTVTVKSADGYSLTWTFGSPIHVVEHRSTVAPSNVAVGEKLGVAGTKSGSTVTASLLVIPQGK